MLETIEQLQNREIQMLRERVRLLEDQLVPPTVRIPVEWCLTSSEARLFAHLTSRDMCTTSSIMLALYSGRIDVEPEPKIVDVFVCKIRKKLKPFGVIIETIWGQGYSLPSREQFQIKPPSVEVAA